MSASGASPWGSKVPTERRALVRVHGAEARLRSTIFDDILAMTDSGYVVHVSTGVYVNAPLLPDGEPMEVKDDRKFILHMLAADPEGWASSKHYKLGEKLTPALTARLKMSRDSYPGD